MAIYRDLSGNGGTAEIDNPLYRKEMVVPDEVYGATEWNGSSEAPTKNAVYDKIESMKAAARADDASTIPSAAPAGGVGTAAGGWDTAANRDAAIATINSLRTAVSNLKTEFNDLLAKLRTANTLTP